MDRTPAPCLHVGALPWPDPGPWLAQVLGLILGYLSDYAKEKLINAPDKKGITPVFLAFQGGGQCQKCFEMLLAEGANFDAMASGNKKHFGMEEGPRHSSDEPMLPAVARSREDEEDDEEEDD